MAMLICGGYYANAQISFSINIGSQPAWGPVGYDRADYYYLPDIDAYFDIGRRVFVYPEGRRWVTAAALPPRYGAVDLYRVHKVVINNDRSPWMHNDRYRGKYRSFIGRRDQQAIRDAHDQKYWQNPGHPEYNKWKRDHDNGRRGNDDHDRGHGRHGRGH